MKLIVWFRDGSDAESQIKPVTDIVASIEYNDVDHHYGDVGDEMLDIPTQNQICLII